MRQTKTITAITATLLSLYPLQYSYSRGAYLGFLAGLFVLCLLMDLRFARRHALPAWFLRLRVALTTGAVLSLGIAGWVLVPMALHT